jgi:hypothetical protein
MMYKIILIIFIICLSCNSSTSSSSSTTTTTTTTTKKSLQNEAPSELKTKKVIKPSSLDVGKRMDDDEILSATLLHDSVLVNGRFKKYVVSELVSFAVITIRFNNDVYVSSPQSEPSAAASFTDREGSGWEEQDLDAMLNTNYYPENNGDKKSEFGLTELNCYNDQTNKYHTFKSYPDDSDIVNNKTTPGDQEIVDIPETLLVPRFDLNTYPWAEAFLQSATLIGMEKGHVGSKSIFDKDITGLNDAIDRNADHGYKYQAVIFDTIFDTNEVDLNHVTCNLTLVQPAQQTWLPKRAFFNSKTRQMLSTKSVPLIIKRLDFNDLDTKTEKVQKKGHQTLLKISNHIEDNIDRISNVVLKSYDKEDANIDLSDENCVSVPDELLSHSGVVALLQTGVKDMHTEVDDELPALILPILQLILMPVSKLLASLFGHKVVEKMHMSGGYEIREGLIKDVAEDVAARVINGVSRTVVPGLMASVPDAVSTSIMEIIQTYLIEDLSPNTEHVFGEKMAEMLQPTVYKDIAPEAARLLTHRATRSVTHSLTRSLAHSIVPALSHTITHSPLQDYYCYFCFHQKVYCSFCTYSPTQLYYSLYYAGFYSAYFGDYYSEYFSKPEEYGFLTPDKTSDNIRDGHDPFLQEDDPNIHTTNSPAQFQYNQA